MKTLQFLTSSRGNLEGDRSSSCPALFLLWRNRSSHPPKNQAPCNCPSRRPDPKRTKANGKIPIDFSGLWILPYTAPLSPPEPVPPAPQHPCCSSLHPTSCSLYFFPSLRSLFQPEANSGSCTRAAGTALKGCKRGWSRETAGCVAENEPQSGRWRRRWELALQGHLFKPLNGGPVHNCVILQSRMNIA